MYIKILIKQRLCITEHYFLLLFLSSQQIFLGCAKCRGRLLYKCLYGHRWQLVNLTNWLMSGESVIDEVRRIKCQVFVAPVIVVTAWIGNTIGSEELGNLVRHSFHL